MPFLAILRHDLRSLTGSWLVRMWLAAAALLALLMTASFWTQHQSARLIGSLLSPYLIFPWFLVVMVLGVSPVSGSRVEALADGFLSRPVTRRQYLLAIWASRVVLVLGCFLLVMVPTVAVVALAKRPVAEDALTMYGIIGALGATGMVLTFQVSLAFFMGVLLRKPTFAIVLTLFIWYPVSLLLNTFKLESISPITLNQAMPTLLRQPWRASAAPEEDSVRMDDLRAMRAAANFFSVLSGAAPSTAPEKNVPFFERKFEDFSLGRVVLGYGIPTLTTLAAALFWFCSRDL